MKKIVLLFSILVLGIVSFSFGFFENVEIFFAKMGYNTNWTMHESSSQGNPKIIEKEFRLDKKDNVKFFVMGKTNKERMTIKLVNEYNEVIFEDVDSKIYAKEKYNLDRGLYKLEILLENSKEAHIFIGIKAKITKVDSERN